MDDLLGPRLLPAANAAVLAVLRHPALLQASPLSVLFRIHLKTGALHPFKSILPLSLLCHLTVFKWTQKTVFLSTWPFTLWVRPCNSFASSSLQSFHLWSPLSQSQTHSLRNSFSLWVWIRLQSLVPSGSKEPREQFHSWELLLSLFLVKVLIA